MMLIINILSKKKKKKERMFAEYLSTVLGEDRSLINVV